MRNEHEYAKEAVLDEGEAGRLVDKISLEEQHYQCKSPGEAHLLKV